MTGITDGGKLHDDHWSTEQQAALLQTSERKRKTYEQILRLLSLPDPVAPGMTDDELRRALQNETGVQQSKSGPATRRGELVEMGLVRPKRWAYTDEQGVAGEIVKRPSDLGGPMIVWELVPANEYVKPAPRPAGRTPNRDGLRAARRQMEWTAGDPELADAAIAAYLAPAATMRDLDDIGAP